MEKRNLNMWSRREEIPVMTRHALSWIRRIVRMRMIKMN